jgi:hypothetical protein
MKIKLLLLSKLPFIIYETKIIIIIIIICL